MRSIHNLKVIRALIVYGFFIMLIIFSAKAELPRRKISVKDAFKISAGIKALPAKAVEVKDIATRHGLQEFRLSKSLLKDRYSQRIIEYSYPIRLNPNSNYVFSTVHSTMYDCNLIEAGKNVALYKCNR